MAARAVIGIRLPLEIVRATRAIAGIPRCIDGIPTDRSRRSSPLLRLTAPMLSKRPRLPKSAV